MILFNGGLTLYYDYRGQPVRLTEERWREHILPQRPWLELMPAVIGETLQAPEVVRLSNRDPGPNPGQARLYYRWYNATPVGDKWICVVVLFLDSGDAFVMSAYPTDRLKRGVEIWRTTARAR